MKKIQNIGFLEIFITLSFLFLGLFHEFLACAAGIALCVYLIWRAAKNGRFLWYNNTASLSVVLLVLFYGLTVFWAVDKGAAVWGFFKFLPLLLFMFVLMQRQTDSGGCLEILPYIAAFMTAVSSVLMQIPALKRYFSVAGRLAGFFQYPNTFALFSLLAIMVTATKEKLSKTDFLLIPLLLFGILYSGSRTVFALTLLSFMILLFRSKNKKLRIALLSAGGGLVGVAVVYAAVTKNFSAIGRFLTTSLTSSTFLGRWLYFQDALPVILRHPFGLGYIGYSYMQYSIQTGVYTVRFIHNDFLQLLLDVGWLPTSVLLAAIGRAFFKKGASFRQRILLFVLAAHSCFDFNLQYLALFMLLLLLLNVRDGTAMELNLPGAVRSAAPVLLSVLFAYFAAAQSLSYFKLYAKAVQLYPWDTQAQVALFSEIKPENLERHADKILKNNSHVPVAYRIKARASFSRGDFKNVIFYEEKAIAAAPFIYDTYEEYSRLLINGIYLYEKAGDEASAERCRQELLKLADSLKSLPQRQSRLGKMIKDQPRTELPDEVEKHIDAAAQRKKSFVLYRECPGALPLGTTAF